jgi:alpha-beta hydrolase superfamily lysophospholipase
MKCELVEFQTTDKLMLPGLLYKPSQKTKKCAVFLHGMGASVFHKSKLMNTMAEALAKQDTAFLAFNNRGANLLQRLKKNGSDKSQITGMSYDLIKDCVKDIDGAVKYLTKFGYTELYLIGHSSGANKICVYNFYKPKNHIKKFVLLGGGDDVGLEYQALGKIKFRRLLELAKTQISMGNGKALVRDKTAEEGHMFSYSSLHDVFNPDGDYNIFPFMERIEGTKLSNKSLFRHYKSIKKPTLVIYGSNDSYCYGNAPKIIDILKQETMEPDKFTFTIIKDADHSFHGKEQQLVKNIANWLSNNKY